MPQLDLEKVPTFYHNYLKLITEDSLTIAFSKHTKDIISFLHEIPADKWDYRYAEGKWSIKEIIQHLIDAERIFCYRALTFARKDNIALPGFDENHYTAVAKADRRNVKELIEELELVQQASAKLFESFDDEQLNAEGVANNNKVYVEGIGFIIIGHCRHHKRILKERYL